jgi:hypothetical protein
MLTARKAAAELGSAVALSAGAGAGFMAWRQDDFGQQHIRKIKK